MPGTLITFAVQVVEVYSDREKLIDCWHMLPGP
jgi:hypothetical protein